MRFAVAVVVLFSVGSHFNFYLRGSYCGGSVCVSFAHISHGAAAFGIDKDAGNKGLNFLFLEYRYR